MDWRCGSSRTPALQAQSPEFKLQSHKKKIILHKLWHMSIVSLNKSSIIKAITLKLRSVKFSKVYLSKNKSYRRRQYSRPKMVRKAPPNQCRLGDLQKQPDWLLSSFALGRYGLISWQSATDKLNFCCRLILSCWVTKWILRLGYNFLAHQARV
jgi:hypothetical protein